MYSIEGLQEGIKNCKRNIKVLEEATEKERKTIADYRIMIDEIEEQERVKEHVAANVHVEIEED